MLAFLPKKEAKFSLNCNWFFRNKVLCINLWNKVSAIWASVLFSILDKMEFLNQPSVDQALTLLIRASKPFFSRYSRSIWDWLRSKKPLYPKLPKKGKYQVYFQICKGGMRINSIKRLRFLVIKGRIIVCWLQSNFLAVRLDLLYLLYA